MMANEIEIEKRELLIQLEEQIAETLEKLRAVKKKAVQKQVYSEAIRIRNTEFALNVFKQDLRENHIDQESDASNQKQYYYQLHADKLFANGKPWHHRTLRTIFDPYSSEYGHTTLEDKKEILIKILESRFPFELLAKEYKQFYAEQNKPGIERMFEQGLVRLLETKEYRVGYLDNYIVD